jgi:hypothetical protein
MDALGLPGGSRVGTADLFVENVEIVGLRRKTNQGKFIDSVSL